MSEQIQISVAEYEAMKEELALLKDTPLLKKMNRLVDLLFEDKYGLYMGDFTGDLTEATLKSSSAWDNGLFNRYEELNLNVHLCSTSFPRPSVI